MRTGVFRYRLTLPEGVAHAIVHRGVSQAPKGVEPETRRRRWVGSKTTIPDGISNLPRLEVIEFTLEALQEMERRGLVFLADPADPFVWTPKRIRRQAERVIGASDSISSSPPRRRTRLEL